MNLKVFLRFSLIFFECFFLIYMYKVNVLSDNEIKLKYGGKHYEYRIKRKSKFNGGKL